MFFVLYLGKLHLQGKQDHITLSSCSCSCWSDLFSKKAEGPRLRRFKLDRMQFGRIVLQVNAHQLTESDFRLMSLFQPQRVKYKLGMIMRRCLNGTAPHYLAAHCVPVFATASRQHLRSAASHQLVVPSYRLSSYGRRAFSVAGPTTWNSLPKQLHDPVHTTSVFACLL